MAETNRSIWWRTACILLPLIGIYCWAVLTMTGLAWANYSNVAWLFAWTALGMSAGAYVCCRVAAFVRGGGALLSLDHALWALLGACCLALLLPGFSAFKQLVLPERGFVLDPLLAAMGRTVTGGTSPWVFTHKLFGGIWPTLVLDRLYSFWSLLFMAFPILVPFVTGDPRQRARMQIAWVLAWVLIGSAAAWVLASAGPCYYNHLVGPDASFMALNERLGAIEAEARRLGLGLNNIEFQSLLRQAHQSGRYAPAAGISAMPSMHVTMATLIAVAGWSISRPLGHVLAAYGVVIWIASIHLGWHYAADEPVAVVMMLAVWRLAGRIVRAIDGEDGRARPQSELCPA